MVRIIQTPSFLLLTLQFQLSGKSECDLFFARLSAGPNISIASTPWFPASNFLSPFLQISGERGEGNKRCLFVLHMGKEWLPLFFFPGFAGGGGGKRQISPSIVSYKEQKTPIALDTQTPNKCLFLRRYQTRAWRQQKRQENIWETLDLIKSLLCGAWYGVWWQTRYKLAPIFRRHPLFQIQSHSHPPSSKMCQICASHQFPEIHIQIKISPRKTFSWKYDKEKGGCSPLVFIYFHRVDGWKQTGVVEVLDRRERGCQWSIKGLSPPLLFQCWHVWTELIGRGRGGGHHFQKKRSSNLQPTSEETSRVTPKWKLKKK